MAAPSPFEMLSAPITCHAYNADKSLVAFCPSNDEVHIWSTNGAPDDSKKWTQNQVLTSHSGTVCSMDWHPVTNKLATCGHDRNAFVFVFDEKENKWDPQMVVLRIQRAAITVKWSPYGNKLAVASGDKRVSVAYFDPEDSWWPAKHIKATKEKKTGIISGIKSTVLDVAWHPNNKYIILGGCDRYARIYSAYMPKKGDDPSKYEDVKVAAAEDEFSAYFAGKKQSFGTLLAEFNDANAWVNAVAWSPCGTLAAFAGQGSSLHVVQLSDSDEPKVVSSVYYSHRPLTRIAFLSGSAILGVGYDMNPMLFVGDSSTGEFQFGELVDKGQFTVAPKKKASRFGSSLSMFEKASSQGHSVGGKKKTETETKTRHKNFIMSLQFVSSDGAGVFSTSGLDGKIFTWDLGKAKLEASTNTAIGI